MQQGWNRRPSPRNRCQGALRGAVRPARPQGPGAFAILQPCDLDVAIDGSGASSDLQEGLSSPWAPCCPCDCHHFQQGK